jgi:putative ABC transport system ATP-binding protein
VPSDSIILRAEALGRTVGEKVLVENASFHVLHGEILTVVGPSGSGKTSLLRLLNRLDEPSNGTVYLQEVDYREIPPRQLRRRVGMVMQRPFLFPGTVAANLRFGPAQRGEQMTTADIEKLIASVGLPGFADRNIANLSGGEAQRVSFARALANSPNVLLLDEPTSALDDVAKVGIETLIRQIGDERGISCVMVTHDTAQAARLANRVLVMESGKVARQGTAREVLNA